MASMSNYQKFRSPRMSALHTSTTFQSQILSEQLAVPPAFPFIPNPFLGNVSGRNLQDLAPVILSYGNIKTHIKAQNWFQDTFIAHNPLIHGFNSFYRDKSLKTI
jgi:hypothetical protein